jgi:Domain of unknown function (DUF6794)
MGDGDLASRAQQDIAAILEEMGPEARQSMRAMTESDLSRLHHGYGTWLRNQFRQGKFPHLFRFCDLRMTPETRSFDAISGVAIPEIWRHLRSSNVG